MIKEKLENYGRVLKQKISLKDNEVFDLDEEQVDAIINEIKNRRNDN